MPIEKRAFGTTGHQSTVTIFGADEERAREAIGAAFDEIERVEALAPSA